MDKTIKNLGQGKAEPKLCPKSGYSNYQFLPCPVKLERGMKDPIINAYEAINKPDWSEKISPKVLRWMQEEERKEKNKQKITSAVILITCIIGAGIICLFSSCGMARASNITPLSVAQSQIGLGEIGANNTGVYVRKYLGGKDNLPWCAGFISYCLKEAGIRLPYILRAKDYLNMGIKVDRPKPGDLAVFSRNGGGHIGIIEKVDVNKITTIEGNTGNYPSKVKRIVYKGKPKNLIAYIRLNGAN